jgi:hypothetical protein
MRRFIIDGDKMVLNRPNPPESKVRVGEGEARGGMAASCASRCRASMLRAYVLPVPHALHGFVHAYRCPCPRPLTCCYPVPLLQVDDCEFEEGEVYAIDIIVSTGEGKPKLVRGLCGGTCEGVRA